MYLRVVQLPPVLQSPPRFRLVPQTLLACRQVLLSARVFRLLPARVPVYPRHLVRLRHSVLHLVSLLVVPLALLFPQARPFRPLPPRP